MSSRLVFALSLSALIFSIGNLFSSGLEKNNPNYRSVCIGQGWLLQFSENAIFGWITTIALNLYLVVCWHLTTHPFEKYYHIGVWTWALFCACIPFVVTDVYDIAGIWCWISRVYPILRFTLFYIPFIIQVVIVLILYILIIRTLSNSPTEEGDSERKIKLLVTRLRAYPVIFFVLYLFPTINRIHDAVSNNDSFPLYVLQVITAPSIGFVNALAYGDNDIRQMWVELFKNLFCAKPEIIPVVEPDPNHSDEEITFQSEVTTNNETSVSQLNNL
jgi:hypothetical protein